MCRAVCWGFLDEQYCVWDVPVGLSPSSLGYVSTGGSAADTWVRSVNCALFVGDSMVLANTSDSLERALLAGCLVDVAKIVNF